jgi:hypothetical protein
MFTGFAVSEQRKPGRPALPPGKALKVGSIRLTAAQWDKLAKLGGGAWVRKRIDRARVQKANATSTTQTDDK